MALVMGMPSAQEILRNVQDDLNESSGVYAILNSSPFISFAEGVGAIITGANCPSASATGCRRLYSVLKFGYNNDYGMKDWRGLVRCLAVLWIMKSREIGKE